MTVDKHVREDGMYFLHSFDDANLICGCARYASEILYNYGNILHIIRLT